MKLLHSADLHLDRTFEGLKNLPLALKEELQVVNRHVLNNIVDLAIKEEVDIVVFAGDTFHQSRTSIRTQAFFIDALNRLKKEAIHVILMFGNHDYYVKERYWFDFPDNVFLFEKEQVETHYFTTKAHEKVAISSFSYEHSWINKPMLTEFPIRDAKVDSHIGIYHGDTTINGKQNYAPFTFSEMKSKGYDYWALGHIHQSQIVSAQPLIVYPGTPQGHTKKEKELKGVAIVQVKNGHATVHFESVAEVVWQTETCSLEQCQTLQDVLTLLTDRLINWSDSSRAIRLGQVYLTNTDSLGEEFRIAYEEGEVLAYLQEFCTNNVNHKWFLFDLLVEDHQKEQKMAIPATVDLLNKLEQTYLQDTIFTDVMNELTKNSQFHTAIDIDEGLIEKSLFTADQIIKEDFTIQEGS